MDGVFIYFFMYLLTLLLGGRYGINDGTSHGAGSKNDIYNVEKCIKTKRALRSGYRPVFLVASIPSQCGHVILPASITICITRSWVWG